MNLQEQLKEKGWYLSPEAIDQYCKSIEVATVDAVIQKAINSDFHEIGAKFLPDDVVRGKADSLSGPAILQIQKIRDVSAPKLCDGYGNSPTLLRVQLTDGHSSCNAVQWGNWKCVSQDTPPGTKLYLKPGKIKIQNCFLVLSENQFAIVGGVVDALVEKWELNRSLACHIRATTESDGGPPPWIPFGQFIDTNSLRPIRGNFRSLEQNQKEGKENEAFEQQRNATIAEIARAKEGKRKVFGGGKQIQEAEGNFNKQITSNFRNGNLETSSQQMHQTSMKSQLSNRWENKSTTISKQDQNFKKWEKGGQQSDNRPSGGSTLFDFLQSQISLPAESNNLNDTIVTPPNPAVHSEPNWTKNGQLPNNSKEKEDKYTRNRQERFQDYKANLGNTNHTFKETETFYRPREGANNQRYNNNKSDDYQNRNKTKNFRDYDKTRYRNSETNVESKTNSRYPDTKNTKLNKAKPIYDENKWHIEERKGKTASYNEKQFQSSTLGPYKESEKPFTSKEGDKVLAKYWEDSKFYPAIIHAVSSSGTTCVVLFTEYGNYEEVLMEDIQQLTSQQEFVCSSGDSPSNAEFQNDLSRQNFVGTLEFRRGRNKPYINMDANNSTFRGDKKGDGNSRPARQLYQPPAQRRHVGP